MAYYASNKIKVYPTSLRSVDTDYNARLNTEKNITSLVNRLSSIDSFIISGILNSDGRLTFDNTSKIPTLQTGSINIHGYIFELDSQLDLIGAPSDNQYLAFKIELQDFIVDSTTTFTQLKGTDASSGYQGLTLDYYNDVTNSDNVYYLPIAKYENQTWKLLSCKLKYNAKDLRVDFTNNDLITDSKLKKDTDIQSWLASSYIIDDGCLDD